jgi:acyl-CoA synthetase (NDP forming)
VSMSGWLQGPGALDAEVNPHVALFRSMDRCFRSLAAWHHRADLLAGGERTLVRVSDPAAVPLAARMIADAVHHRLTERESKAILKLYGIPTTREMRVDSADAAVAAAAQLGFPLAVKIESPDIVHKTDAGVVALGVRSNVELREAYERVMTNAKANTPRADIRGVLLQPMAPPGVEVVVGVRVDQGFGPLIVVGFG